MKKIWAKILICCMILIIAVPSIAAADTDTAAQPTISIVFTHDMHSHLEKFAKIRTVVKEKQKQEKAAFVLDAGDFSMGTPYQTIFKTEASELRMMGAAGFDVTTLGNHEFDYRSKGLSEMLERAVESKGKLPQLVAANIDWDKTLADAALKEDGENLKAALENYGCEDYTVIERGGVKIAVFGIFGEESASYAPESGTYFKDPIETSRQVVENIKAHEKVDMIVCLSHSGTNPDDPDKSEDEILAREVDGIDLIISGHSHTELQEPLIVEDTVIASAGQYNDNLGTITFHYKDGKYRMDKYELIPLNDSIKNNSSIQRLTDRFKERVNDKYFNKFGYGWNTVLANNDVEFTEIDEFGDEQGEDTLGNLIADSYIYGVEQAEGSDYEDVDVALVPSGAIRGSFGKGKINASDAFNALSLGTGKDGIAGYPLVSVYLTGAELKLTAEIDASISNIMEPARLYLSGLNYTYNPHRLILNRAYDVKLEDRSGKTVEIDDDKLYRVVGNLYSAQMLGTVNGMSYGLLSITPKDENGNEIEDFEDYIIRNRDGSELKEWYALASYIDDFSGNKVPAKYEQTEGRKILEDSWNPVDLFKKPNKFFWIIAAAAALILSILALFIILIVKLVKRSRHGKRRLRKKDMIFSRR